MAKKPTISTISSGYYSRQALNTNFENLRDAFDNTLSLDGSTPNAMQADLDMNNNDILNGDRISTKTLYVDGNLLTTTTAALAPDANAVNYNQGDINAVDRTVESRLQDFVSVKDFGAVGDGITDDTAAIQAALDYCNTFSSSENKPFLYGAPGEYLVTNTLTLSCNCDLSEMTIVADATSVSPVIRVGGTSSSEITWKKNITLPRLVNNSRVSGQWGDGIGAQVTNCNTCYITVPNIQFFEVGINFGGSDQGFVYNTVNLLYIYDNKINVRLKPVTSGGWANQNLFIGGRLGVSTSTPSGTTNTDSRNISLERWDRSVTTGFLPNNNLFLNTSIEGDIVEFSLDIQGDYNQFQSCRYEGTAAKRVQFFSQTASETNSNLIIGGYQAGQITYTFTGAGTSVYNSAINGRQNYIETSGVGFSIKTGGSSQPHIQGFNAGDTALGKGSSATDWQYRLLESQFFGKDDDDAEARVHLDWFSSTGRIYFGDGTVDPTTYITGNENSCSVNGYNAFRPGDNNTMTLGTGVYRWSEVFAVNGTINTSDARQKQQVRTLSEQEQAVALRCKSLLRAFKWNSAVEEKGDDARIHFGIIAQDLADAFRAEGLNPDHYSMFSYDKWEAEYEPEIATRTVERFDEDGNPFFEEERYKTGEQVLVREAGDTYGVRYSELLAFIISAL